MTEHFPFLSLPLDIRRLVYDLLSEKKLYHVFSKKHPIWYEDYKPVVPLLQTSKALNFEYGDASNRTRFSQPRPIICRGGNQKQGQELLELVHTAVTFDATSIKKLNLAANEAVPDKVADWTINITASQYRRALMSGYIISDPPDKKDRVDAEIKPLKAFLRTAVLSLRRHKTLEFRILTGISGGFWTWSGGREPILISICWDARNRICSGLKVRVTMVTANDQKQKDIQAMVPNLAKLGISVDLQWDFASKEELAIMAK
ncbi:hypothetical protein K504DRAFT_445894 [Pleomassaria siparia CBS 279.74]|uniref:Uncharacterized protein n=1 Tax=Pleomassaria siparia CBS 279.74 TaxID=1314801 RepID=A0A6G1KRM4_9PLEO|nr:hypothetical protein K504DRAFT_445894 [Pleomassaria siparia CBS 279.74]